MRARALVLPIAIGFGFLASGLAGCSSTVESDSVARQAAAAPPGSGAGICLQNETSSNFGGSSINTRPQDGEIFIQPGQTVCGYWVGASAPKLVLQGAVGPSFEVVRTGNTDINFCGEEFSLPFGTEDGESAERTINCVGNNYGVKFNKSTGCTTNYTAVVRDA